MAQHRPPRAPCVPLVPCLAAGLVAGLATLTAGQLLPEPLAPFASFYAAVGHGLTLAVLLAALVAVFQAGRQGRRLHDGDVPIRGSWLEEAAGVAPDSEEEIEQRHQTWLRDAGRTWSLLTVLGLLPPLLGLAAGWSGAPSKTVLPPVFLAGVFEGILLLAALAGAQLRWDALLTDVHDHLRRPFASPGDDTPPDDGTPLPAAEEAYWQENLVESAKNRSAEPVSEGRAPSAPKVRNPWDNMGEGAAPAATPWPPPPPPEEPAAPEGLAPPPG